MKTRRVIFTIAGIIISIQCYGQSTNETFDQNGNAINIESEKVETSRNMLVDQYGREVDDANISVRKTEEPGHLLLDEYGNVIEKISLEKNELVDANGNLLKLESEEIKASEKVLLDKHGNTVLIEVNSAKEGETFDENGNLIRKED